MQISDTAFVATEPRNASGYDTQDFETFLKMLTTQIQNQDPLSPLNSDDFSNQLAAFSLVEQQTLTNQNLERIIKQQNALGSLEYASLVGRTIVHGAKFQFTGDTVDFEIDTTVISDDAKVAILDDQERLVTELAIGSGQSIVSWDGTNSDGRLVLPTSLSAELIRQSDGALMENAVFTSSMVREVRLGSGDVVLELSDGTVIPYDQVTKIR
jgi:flagellar basal-body rod modification protein FlgD